MCIVMYIMKREQLEEFNPWWITKKVDPELALPFKRDIYPEIKKSIGRRFILALVGLRRTGKTTMVYQLISELIKDMINPENILFFSFDDIAFDIDEVIETYKEIHKKEFREEKVYIFMDEIQKCRNWENKIKKYYDLYPKIKFVITGSESLFIRKKTKETLAGRILEYKLYPFNFAEYLRINNIKPEYGTRVKPYFLKYLERGGFPETFSMESEREFREYIRSIVVDKIVYKDMPAIFGIDDPGFLILLMELIAKNPGMYIDYQSLSKQYGKDRRVIKNYLNYLEESFLIRVLINYRRGTTNLRKRKRAYPSDNALIYLYNRKYDDALFGKLVETAIVNAVGSPFFWKNGNEVDIILDEIPIEVKYKGAIKNEDLKGVAEFLKKFKGRKGIVITKNADREVKISRGRIKLIPALKWFMDGASGKGLKHG